VDAGECLNLIDAHGFGYGYPPAKSCSSHREQVFGIRMNQRHDYVHLVVMMMSTAEQLWIRPVAFKNILFAMDLSATSLLAFQFAAEVAVQYGGKVFVAHVITERESQFDQAHSREALVRGLENALRPRPYHLADVPHEIVLAQGDVSSGVLSTIEKLHVDLLVIGTHGWHGIQSLLKGSTSRSISALAARPVMMVGPKVTRAAQFRTILYATDFSDASAHALPYATSLTEMFDAKLILLHVNEWSSAEAPSDAGSRTSKFVHEQLQNMGFGKNVLDNCEVVVDFGRRADLIVETAGNRAADLIVMGSHVQHGLKSRIAAHLPGSVGYEVTSRVNSPVLTVPFES